MRRINLEGNDGALRPLAVIEVLAVMCFPSQKQSREKLLHHLIESPADPLPSSMSTAMQRASLAGEIYTTLLQLHDAGLRPSINNVLKILQASPDHVEHRNWPLTGPAWVEWRDSPKLRIHRNTVQACFREFVPVRHFWAVCTLYLAHILTENENAFWPSSNTDLPAFLAGADQLGELGTKVVLPSAPRQRTRQWLFESKYAYRFVIPSNLRCRVDLTLPALSDAALTALRG